MRMIFILMGWVWFLAGCSEVNPQAQDSGTPGRRHYLSSAEIVDAEAAARIGDARAVTRLINHYQWAVADQDKALQWLRKGVELGDAYAMLNLSSQLAAHGTESDCKEAERLLERVLTSSSSRNLVLTAESDLRVLRHGVDGSGYCTRWLGGKAP